MAANAAYTAMLTRIAQEGSLYDRDGKPYPWPTIMRYILGPRTRTSEHSTTEPQRTGRKIDGNWIMGSMISWHLTTKPLLMNNAAVKLSRTCKNFRGWYRELYDENHLAFRQMDDVWGLFVNEVARRVFEMEELHTCNYFLTRAEGTHPVSVVAGHHYFPAGNEPHEVGQRRTYVRWGNLGPAHVLRTNFSEQNVREWLDDQFRKKLEDSLAVTISEPGEQNDDDMGSDDDMGGDDDMDEHSEDGEDGEDGEAAARAAEAAQRDEDGPIEDDPDDDDDLRRYLQTLDDEDEADDEDKDKDKDEDA